MYFFVQVYRGLKSCISFLENLVFVFLVALLGTSRCLVFVPLTNTALLLGTPMLPTRWVKVSTYLQSERFISIIIYNFLPKIINIIIS
jgi:hypothetical protein